MFASLNQLSGKVAQYLEADSVLLATYLSDSELPAKYGFETATFTSMFIPETYEFFWTTSPEDFADRMKQEYEKFWDGERDRKAEKMENDPCGGSHPGFHCGRRDPVTMMKTAVWPDYI